jgi:hypothetical protein
MIPPCAAADNRPARVKLLIIMALIATVSAFISPLVTDRVGIWHQSPGESSKNG